MILFRPNSIVLGHGLHVPGPTPRHTVAFIIIELIYSQRTDAHIYLLPLVMHLFIYSSIHLENIFQVFHATEFTLAGRTELLMGRRRDMWFQSRELLSFHYLAFDTCHFAAVPL